MKAFKIVPLSIAIADEIKTKMKDRWGHTLEYTTPEKRMNQTGCFLLKVERIEPALFL